MADSIQPDYNLAIDFDKSTDSFQAYSDIGGTLLEPQSFNDSIKTEDELKKSIQQLLRAAEYVHGESGVHGNIKMEDIFVAKSRILIQSTTVFPSFEIVTNSISSVYEECMSIYKAASDKISDLKTAKDWSSLVREKQPIEIILRHPFFWDDKNKLDFICNVAQFVKIGRAEPPNNTQRLQNLVKLERNKKLKYKDWKLALNIDKEERDQYDKAWKDDRDRLNKNKEKQSKISAVKIKNLTKDRYNNTLSSLINFIRNHHEHFWEQDRQVRACFRNDRTYGYWKFFTADRFKDLFHDVYVVASSFEEYGIFKILWPAL